MESAIAEHYGKKGMPVPPIGIIIRGQIGGQYYHRAFEKTLTINSFCPQPAIGELPAGV